MVHLVAAVLVIPLVVSAVAVAIVAGHHVAASPTPTPGHLVPPPPASQHT
jgi:hypothetical protein